MVFPSRTPARRRLRVPGLAVAVLLAVVMSGCTPATTNEPATKGEPAPAAATRSPTRPDPATDPAYAVFYGQKVTWKGCQDGFECTSVTVPMDWDKPAGQTLTLAVARSKAKGKRIGSLFLNPGGPGVPGIPYLRSVVGELPKEIRKAYDIAAWDTRGVGDSRPKITCLPNSALDAFYAADATPDSPAEVADMVTSLRAFAAACTAHTGALLGHVDTISTVKDMDVLRAVVGDQTLTYKGASYGTFLGAWYAQLFPWRVGRLVLDGAVDPSLDSTQYTQGQAKGFVRAVQAYVDHCLRSRGCPLRGSRADAYGQLERLITRADAQPLRTEGRPLTQALLVTGLIAAMYSEQLWPALTQGLTQALAGDGTTMLLLADSYLERDADGTYGNLLQAFTTIGCLDSGETRSVEQIAADAAAMKAKEPLFGDTFGWGGLSCAVWPLPDVVPQQRTTAVGAAPIVVIGTTNDPATPYEWAQGLASQLSSGRLITREGEGHTGYGMGSACVDAAVNAYLLHGTVPAEGLTCR
ncbi:MAG: alpha/beta hydrolase [Kineosporiaceae bacterium]